ncbi:Chymotrypsinogen A [Bienertia sinuspersici]
MKGLSLQVNGPCIIEGDFNCHLSLRDRIGNPVIVAECREFKECQGQARVYSRIDRAFVNEEWVEHCVGSSTQFHLELQFDHCLVTI